MSLLSFLYFVLFETKRAAIVVKNKQTCFRQFIPNKLFYVVNTELANFESRPGVLPVVVQLRAANLSL